ncbi:MAG: tetratricopeptide repeat protein [Methylacidiphilaceae bacterium]|nr:tetratricopeptide repeat protein [Candidatus Methylacidiphilaceae bacterium]
MKSSFQDSLGFPEPSPPARRETGRASSFSFLLLLGTGLWLFPSSARAGTPDDRAAAFTRLPIVEEGFVTERSGVRDAAIQLAEYSESQFRKSDIEERGGNAQATEEGELPYFERAIALENSREWKRLLDLSVRWTGAYPNEGAAWFFLGLAYENLAKYDKAIHAYWEAIQRRQDFYKAWCNLGTCYAYLGRYSEAVNAFQKAVQQKDDFGRAWSDLGGTYVQLGRYAEAVRALEKATQLRSDLPEAWCNLGTAYAELKNYDPAISATKKAVRLKPDYAEAWFNLATLYKATGRKDEMAKACQRVREIDPKLAKELSGKLTAP